MNTETNLEVTFTVTEDELQRALTTGLVLPHPEEDKIVVWGPSIYAEKVDTENDGVDVCIATKNTEEDIQHPSGISYRTTSERYVYHFELEE